MSIKGRMHLAVQEQRAKSSRLFAFLVALLAVLIMLFLLIRSELFNLGTIYVCGNKYMTIEEVYGIAGIPQNVNILRLNTMNIKTRLLQDLRVAEVEVKREFPSSIVITVKERKPAAYIASGYGFLELDGQGVVLAVYKNLKQLKVPMITGLTEENYYVGDKVKNESVLSILGYLDRLDEETLNKISEVNIRTNNVVTLYTVNSINIKLGNVNTVIDKAKITCDILNEVSGKNMAVEYIDLTYASPFLKFKHKL